MRYFIAFLLSIAVTTTFAKSPPKVHSSIKKAYHCTCAVQDKRGRIRGTGVLLSNGYVITAGHVVDSNRNGKLDDFERLLHLKFYSPKVEKITGWAISLGGKDGKHWAKSYVDVAIVIPSKVMVSKVKLSTEDSIGSPVMTIGHPLGQLPTITKGYISAPNRRGGRVTAPIYFGSSGGGVFAKGSQDCLGIIVRVAADRRRGSIITHMGEYVRSKNILEAIVTAKKKDGGLGLLKFYDHQVEKKMGVKKKTKKIKKPAKKKKRRKRGWNRFF